MARSFIIEQKKEVIRSIVPVFDNLAGSLIVDGAVLMPEIVYTEKDELPFIMSVNGPVGLRGTAEAYYVSTTKEE